MSEEQVAGKPYTFPSVTAPSGKSLVGWFGEDGKEITDTTLVPDTDGTISIHAVFEDAPLQEGWLQSNSGWQYYVEGTPAIGWLWIDDTYGAHWYYFNEDTYMAASQWVWDEGYSSWYWLCSSGPMIQGLWQWIDNQWYGFWWNGKMCRGWVWDVDWQQWFYCYSNGIMARSAWEGPYWLNWRGIWIH